MDVAFVLFKAFAHGGISRDLAKLVARCRERGHRVRIYTMECAGTVPEGAEVVVLPTRGLRSHVRQRRFAQRAARHLAARPVDLTVGMNKMPGLDVYYAGDSCFEAKARVQRPSLYRLTPRYRHYADFERAVFEEHGRTRILTIAPGQADTFRAVYRTPADRFHELPPGVEPDRAAADPNEAKAFRQQLGVADADTMLLFVGSGFVKKGLDRALRGVAGLPEERRQRTRLFVVGADRARRFQRLARRLGIAERVHFMGGRDDIPLWLAAADALVLPAHDEAAGMVLLEAAVAGLPVLATANCGYASLIDRAGAGVVTPVPFDQARFDADLMHVVTSDERTTWSNRGRKLAEDPSLFAMADRAVDLLEGFAAGGVPLVALCALRYTPADPRYRPLLPLAARCRDLGMTVRIYTNGGDLPVIDGVEVVRVGATALADQARRERRRRWAAEAVGKASANGIVCFDEVPDVPPDVTRFRLSSAGLERLVANPDQPGVEPSLWQANGVVETTCADALPPGLAAQPRPSGVKRDSLRVRYGFEPGHLVFAIAGRDLVSRGVERLLVGIGRLPEEIRDGCRVLAAGELGNSFLAAARTLKLTVEVDGSLAAWDAIAAADVFVDLPYATTPDSWIFDAIAAGRPVVTWAGVADSRWVENARAGTVLAAPYRQADFDRALANLVASQEDRSRWSNNATCFGAEPRHYGQAARLAESISMHIRHREGHAQTLPA